MLRREFALRSAPLLLPALVLVAGIFGGYFLLGYSPKEVAWPQGEVCYEVVVVSEVAEEDRTMGMDAVIVGSGHKLKCYVSKDGRSRQLQVGNRLQLTSHIEPNRNWQHGNFNYRRYLEVHGFSGQTFVKANHWKRKSDSWKGLSLWQRVKLHFLCYRHTLLERYRLLGASDAEYAVLAAMTLGDKTAMTKDLKEVYAVSGASHVLALSGLHLGIIYVLLSMLVPGRRFRMLSQVLIVLSIWGFVLLVGMPVSVVRAAVMISICALLSIFHRNPVSLNSLSLAVICILLANPVSIFDVGFQLSFAAMLSILLVKPLMEGMVSQAYLMKHPLLRWLWGVTTVSVAAQVGVAPLIAYYFGRFSTYFILTNLVVIPAATLILYLTLVTLLLPVTAVLLVKVVEGLNAILQLIATNLPYANIEGLQPTVLQTLAVYVILISSCLIFTLLAKR